MWNLEKQMNLFEKHRNKDSILLYYIISCLCKWFPLSASLCLVYNDMIRDHYLTWHVEDAQ